MSEDFLTLVRDPQPWQAPVPLPGEVVTPRLIVRRYRPGDGSALFAAVEAGREALLPWMPWARVDHQRVDDSIFYVEKVRRGYTAPDPTEFGMGMFDRKTGELVGGTGFHRLRAGLRETEIGYWVRGDRHGQGLCTEAIGALISSGLTPQTEGGWGFRRIVIFNAVANRGSRRVCEKLGLRLEQHTRRDRYVGPLGADGALGYHDCLGFAVLADEWDFSAHHAKPGIGWPGDTLRP